MKAGALCPVPYQIFTDSLGAPLAFGQVQFYAAGSTTPQTVYHDADLSSPWTNPVILDSLGGATIYLSALSYKVKQMTAAGVVVRTVDDVCDIGQGLRATLASTSGVGSINYIRTGTGAVSQTLAQFVADFPFTPQEFGALMDGATDDLAAFDRLIVACGSNAGRCKLLMGTYYLSATWNTTSVPQLIVEGAGLNASYLKTAVTTTPGMIVSNSTTLQSQFRDFQIRQSALALPGSARSGNYGIATATTGSGAGIIIERVGVRYFGDSAIRIAGPTGPTTITECYLYSCSGYGVTIDTVTGQSPQDVVIRDGAIQVIWGGVRVNAGTSVHLDGPDIELGNDGKYPALYVAENAGAGCVVTSVDSTFSVGASATTAPVGVVVIEGQSFGVTIIGGLNSAPNGTANLEFGNAVTGTKNITVIGGQYTNKSSGGGYFCDIHGATDIAIIHPTLITSTYTSNKDRVNDAAANFVTALGVTCASATDQSGAGKVLLAGKRGGATSVADGGTITHGLGATPGRAFATATTTGEFAAITAMSSTTLTIALKKHDNTAGTTAVVNWGVEA